MCVSYVFPPVRKKSQREDCIIELFTYDSRGVYSHRVSRKLPIYRLLTHSLTHSFTTLILLLLNTTHGFLWIRKRDRDGDPLGAAGEVRHGPAAARARLGQEPGDLRLHLELARGVSDCDVMCEWVSEWGCGGARISVREGRRGSMCVCERVRWSDGVDLIYFDSHHHSLNHSLPHSITHSIIYMQHNT